MIIGIDPGLTGAVGFLESAGRYYAVEDMPIIASGKSWKVTREVNGAALWQMLSGMGQRFPLTAAYVERMTARPGQGVSSTFSIGHSYGIVLGILAALQISVVEVQPHIWKKAMSLTPDKEYSRAVAQKLFPLAPLDRKKDHNRAEALLLAAYGIQRHHPEIPATKMPVVQRS